MGLLLYAQMVKNSVGRQKRDVRELQKENRATELMKKLESEEG